MPRDGGAASESPSARRLRPRTALAIHCGAVLVLLIGVGRYYDSRDPLWAISYEESHVRAMVAEAGLDLVETVHGAWCGTPSSMGQDVVVVSRPLRKQSPSPSRLARRGIRRLRTLRRS